MTKAIGMRGTQIWLSGMVTGGGILAAFGAAACCALPLALASAGLGTAWLGSISPMVAPFRTPLLIIAAILLLASTVRLVWQFQRARSCSTDAACGSPTYRALTIAGLVIGTSLLAGTLIYD